MNNRIKKLQSNTIDLDFLDEQVRKKLGLIDKNEIVIILNE
jgi:cell division protein FtsB